MTFDPRVVSYEKLVRHAKARRCDNPVFTRNDAQQKTAAGIVGRKAKRNNDPIRVVKDNKYQLTRTSLRYVPLSPLQSTRINANVRGSKQWLSPRQLALLKTIKANPKAGWPVVSGLPLKEAWKKVDAVSVR